MGGERTEAGRGARRAAGDCPSRHPFEPVSPWLPDPPSDLRPPLAQDLSADVAIVGGGCSGLSTALHLRAHGARVVVLEREFAGSGATGRNAGHLAGPAVMDLPLVVRLNGRRRTEQLVRFARAAVAYLERQLDAWGIDCDYRPSGLLMAAVHPRQERRVREWIALCGRFGLHLALLPRQALAERGIPSTFLCAAYDATGGVFDPGRLALGLRRAALAAGAAIFEQTDVRRVEPGRRVRLRCAGGTVTADRVVLATNAYTRELRRRPRTVLPLRISGFETAPLGEAQLEALGWRRFEALNTMHQVLESYRRTERGSVAGTSKVFTHRFGGRRPAAYAPADFRCLEQGFRARFPMLADVPLRSFWSGWIAQTTAFRPVLGVSAGRGNLLLGLGYCGHGVAQGTLMGAVLAQRIAGGRHPLEECVRRRALSWPPEPLTWGAVGLLRAAMLGADRRTDRALRKAAGTTSGGPRP